MGGGLLTLYLHSGWHERTLSYTKRFCLEQSQSIVDREGTASRHIGGDLTHHIQVIGWLLPHW